MKKFQYKQLVAIIYTCILFLDRLDLTVANVTFPTLASYFKVSIVKTDWINLSFLLALAISIPISSWLSHQFGPKRIYITAMALFGLGSTLCAWAPSLFALNFLRFIQGLGGGMIIPVGMTMLYQAYDKSEYASITSFTFLPALIAPAIAPFLGGILLDALGWRFVFLFSGPICLILIVVSLLVLKEAAKSDVKPLDWLGFGLGSFLLIVIFYALSMFASHELRYSFLSIVAVICLLAGFIFWEKRCRYPLINLDLFNNPIFLNANFIQVCFQICHFGAIFLMGMYLQVGVGFSPSAAGLIMGMQAVGAMTTSRLSVTLFNRSGLQAPLIIGFLGISILSLATMLIKNTQMLIFGMTLFFIRGVFSGLCGTPIQTLSVIGFSEDKDKLGEINSIFNICRQTAIGLGIALSSLMISWGLSVAGLSTTENLPRDQVLAVFRFGFGAIFFVAIIGLLITSRLDKDQIKSFMELSSPHTGKPGQ